MMTDNNEKDKRFSKLLSTVEKGKILPDKQFLAQLREQSAKEFETYSVESKEHSQAETISIWRIIMNRRITKITAVAVIVIAILIGINQFSGSSGGGSIAFGEVLRYIQTSSYTFDLTVETAVKGSPVYTLKAMVWKLGRMRVDWSAGTGRTSSITDFNAGKTLLLFHQNKASVIKTESVLNKTTGAGKIVAFCSMPIENLWNMRDGTEESLNIKEIDGQTVTGFGVSQEDEHFKYDVNIWANSESGAPVLVEVKSEPLKESCPSITWTMHNFDLDVELDEDLFSLDLPTGYTLAYQEDLEKLEVETEPSDESEKIVQMLELWSEDKKDEAIELLLGVNWTKQIEFGKEPYIFSLTEKGYISLKAEDQKQVMEKIMVTASAMRKMVKEALAMGQTDVANQDYEEAERYFEATFQLGKLLAHDLERMIMVRLVGIAIQKVALNEMINLYKTTNNQEKLQAAENRLREAEAAGNRIKKKALGQ